VVATDPAGQPLVVDSGRQPELVSTKPAPQKPVLVDGKQPEAVATKPAGQKLLPVSGRQPEVVATSPAGQPLVPEIGRQPEVVSTKSTPQVWPFWALTKSNATEFELPAAVTTLTCREPDTLANAGTTAVQSALSVHEAVTWVPPKTAAVAPGTKFVPVSATVVPGPPELGLTVESVGVLDPVDVEPDPEPDSEPDPELDVYVNEPAVTVPPSVLTTTSTMPLPDGAVASQCSVSRQVVAAFSPPNVTSVESGTKFRPSMCTTVPAWPLVGLIALTVGAAAANAVWPAIRPATSASAPTAESTPSRRRNPERVCGMICPPSPWQCAAFRASSLLSI
jgi:hypothetical protein